MTFACYRETCPRVRLFHRLSNKNVVQLAMMEPLRALQGTVVTSRLRSVQGQGRVHKGPCLLL
jgi:hypothetical protein